MQSEATTRSNGCSRTSSAAVTLQSGVPHSSARTLSVPVLQLPWCGCHPLPGQQRTTTFWEAHCTPADKYTNWQEGLEHKQMYAPGGVASSIAEQQRADCLPVGQNHLQGHCRIWRSAHCWANVSRLRTLFCQGTCVYAVMIACLYELDSVPSRSADSES